MLGPTAPATSVRATTQYVPGPHSSHVPPSPSVVAQTPLLIDEYVPAAQSSQAVLSEFEVSPAAQSVHETPCLACKCAFCRPRGARGVLRVAITLYVEHCQNEPN